MIRDRAFLGAGRRLAGPFCWGLTALATVALSAAPAAAQNLRAVEALGEALFVERELANPGADFAPSCNTCHFNGQTFVHRLCN